MILVWLYPYTMTIHHVSLHLLVVFPRPHTPLLPSLVPSPSRCIDDRLREQAQEKLQAHCPTCHADIVVPHGQSKGPYDSIERGLRFDFVKDDLVRKLYPRPALDEHLEAERTAREREMRRVKELARGSDPRMSEEDYYRKRTGTLAKRPIGFGLVKGANRPKSQPVGGVMQHAMLFMRLLPDDLKVDTSGRTTVPPLARPYVRVPAQMPIQGLKQLLVSSFPALELQEDRLEVSVAGVVVPNPRWSCSLVYETLFAPYHREGAVMTIRYADTSRAVEDRGGSGSGSGKGR